MQTTSPRSRSERPTMAELPVRKPETLMGHDVLAFVLPLGMLLSGTVTPGPCIGGKAVLYPEQTFGQHDPTRCPACRG